MCWLHKWLVWITSFKQLRNTKQLLYNNKINCSRCVCDCTSDPCDAFRVLNDTWRTPWTVGSMSSPNCDFYIPAGWYRFMLNGNDANMMTTAPSIDRCGVHSPIWWNGKWQNDIKQATSFPEHFFRLLELKSETVLCNQYTFAVTRLIKGTCIKFK